MPQIGTIYASTDRSVLKLVTQSATVANNVQYEPDGVDANGVARWVDRTGDVPAGYPYITMQVRRPTKGSRNYKVTAVLGIPTLETLGTSSQSGFLPAQTVGYVCAARLEFSLPERATGAERARLLSVVSSFLATNVEASDGSPTQTTETPLEAAISDLEGVY